MNENYIYDKIDRGERLTDDEVSFAKKHKIMLWGSVNEAEVIASLPDLPPALPIMSDEEFNHLQALAAKYR